MGYGVATGVGRSGVGAGVDTIVVPGDAVATPVTTGIGATAGVATDVAAVVGTVGGCGVRTGVGSGERLL